MGPDLCQTGLAAGVLQQLQRQLARRMQLSAISESREEEEGLLTKTETQKMTTMTKKASPIWGTKCTCFLM